MSDSNHLRDILSINEGDVELEKDESLEVGSGTENISMDVVDALSQIGFGWFQWILLIICGCIYIADSMEIMLLSFLSRTLKCEWNLEDWQEASISTGVFFGMMFGSVFWGIVSDKWGRRKALMGVIVWTLTFSIVSAFSPNYISILIFRSILGFGIAGIHVGWTIFIEYVPTQSRNWALGLTSCFWTIGAVFEAGLAWLVLPALGWRWFLIISSLPFAISLLGLPYFPESTLYLRVKGQFDEVKQIIERIALLNRSTINLDHVNFSGGKIVELEKSGSYLDIFRSELRVTTFLLFFMWFAVSFGYYGMVLLVSNFSKSRCYSPINNDTLNNISIMNGSKITNGTDCNNIFTNNDYLDILIVSFSEFPGLIVTVVSMEVLGRRLTLFFEFLIAGVASCLVLICFSPVYDTILMFIVRMFISGAFQALYVYTPEVYPSHIRSTALGLCSFFARIGGIAMPFVAQTLGDKHLNIALSIFSCFILLSAVAAFFLPYETRGVNLGEAFIKSSPIDLSTFDHVGLTEMNDSDSENVNSDSFNALSDSEDEEKGEV